MVTISLGEVRSLKNECECTLHELNDLCGNIRSSEINALAMVDTNRRMRNIFANSQKITEDASSTYSPLFDIVSKLNNIYEDVTKTDEFVIGLVDCAGGLK